MLGDLVMLIVSFYFRGEAFVNKRAAPPASVLDPTLPVDSEYCVKPLAQPVFSAAQTDLQAFSAQNGLNGQVGVPVPSAASDAESLKSALLASQPLVYVPSTSLFMLYGSVQEALSPESRSEEDGSGSDVPADLSLAPTAQKRLCEERNPLEDDEPAVKRQSREFEDSPLSLVMPKVRECE